MHRMPGRMGILGILLWAAGVLPADAPGAGDEFTVAVKDGRVTIAAKEAGSNAVLKELARKAGFEVAVRPGDDRQVSLDLQDVPLETAIQQLSGNYAILFARAAGGGYRVLKVTSCGASAQEVGEVLTVAQVIEEIRRKNRAVRSYRADVVESWPDGEEGRRVSLLKGEGGRFRLEMDLPAPEGGKYIQQGGKYIQLSDGEQILIWMPHFESVWRSDLRRVEEELGPEAVRGLDRDWRPARTLGIDDAPADSFRYLGIEEIDGRRAYVVECGMRVPDGMQAAGMPSSRKVWVNVGTGLPERVVFYDGQGTEMRSQRFTNVVPNPTWEGDPFRLDVSAGVPTRDETDEHIEMIRQRKMNDGSAADSPAE